MSSIVDKVKEARKASIALAGTSAEIRNRALLNIADKITREKEYILEENKKDVEEAQKLLKEGKLTKSLVDRLKLDSHKIATIVDGIKDIAKLEDPIGKTTYAIELDDGLELYRVTYPIGVIGVIFESRPDALPQISCLCLKSANSVVLKGGSEAANSNYALYKVIKEASDEVGIPTGWIQLLETREEVSQMLKLHEYIDLIIPRGSRKLVEYIMANTKIPVIGHTEGLCHIYVDKDADVSKAIDICLDAKVNYPAACNATKFLLVHEDIAPEFLPKMARKFIEANVEMRCCERTLSILNKAGVKHEKVKRASDEDWRTEFLDLTIGVRVVESDNAAIDYINTYGSRHTDAIITENKKTALKFATMVDSSSVMINASTRFSDGYRYGLGAEVGISTSKIHARGPTGLEGLVTYKYILVGNGHVVSTYMGPNARKFAHRKLNKTWREIGELCA